MEIKMDAWMRWNGQGMTELSNEINDAAVKEVSKHKQTERKNMCCDDEDGLRSGEEKFTDPMMYMLTKLLIKL